ncbi:DUF1156 domain-containing protein [Halomonas beimenensis]|uniref:Adenine-specific DNA methylase containing a Zn-ribbon n=1 Tax=Halomonas beimenensis TaxID=475662 RepID=A0A291P948_9GAMM|nr:DUF1156 domain-containing protein [Halomonas beimenensis]ATJ83387.1 adenine-specific DNA methylase containing a Zn-ribbon [Halomonas beimenensis]
MTDIKSPKKLIEVALPLDDINAAAAREKSIRHGHPSTLHLWWARRPLAAARAVLFAQLVNDPGYQRELGYGVNKQEAERKREKLFDIIRELVKWENTNNEEVLNRAREAIWESWRETCHLNRNHPQAAELFNPEKLPAAHDPFAGGGTIPLEAQRLGLQSNASDLNPVAVMINKSMVEIPARFSGISPVGPESAIKKQRVLSEKWEGLSGLAEDVRRYGEWMQKKAHDALKNHYPKVVVTSEISESYPHLRGSEGQELTVIAWVWARTIPSPNPAAMGKEIPITSTFVIAGSGEKTAFVEPVVEGGNYRFDVKFGKPGSEAKKGTKLGRGANFFCLLTGTPIPEKYLKKEASEGRLGQKLMAVILESSKGKVVASPSLEMEEVALSASPSFRPDVELSKHPQYMGPPRYGMTNASDLFTDRQTLALGTFLSLLDDVEKKVLDDAASSGALSNDKEPLRSGGAGAFAYAQAIRTYLSFGVDRSSNYWSALNAWGGGFVVQVFSRQVLPMVWDFVEVNPFSSSTGNWLGAVEWVSKVVERSLVPGNSGFALQADASSKVSYLENSVISTDPPYYDNVPYADISDYFYAWLRPALKKVYPEVLGTINVPKSNELVADSQRHGGKQGAEKYFLSGMIEAMSNISEASHSSFPVTIYYAFRQGESTDEGTGNTGWETFLNAVIDSGFSIVGTWPIRTERPTGMKVNWNALASSIVLVCRKRESYVGSISRREFQRYLREQMPESLETMIGGESGQAPIAPVDLAQAAIGPGMAIYSKYEAVLNQDGSRMSVHDALVLINRTITDFLNPDSGNFDADTQFCSSWFDQYAWSEGPFGEADTLARAKGTSVDGVREAGVVESGGGKVRLLKWGEFESDWDPTYDKRTPVWEACHQMIRRLQNHGESAAGELLAKMPEKGEAIRQLSYHLYTLCERKRWAEEARAYNELIGSWHAIVAASHETGHTGEQVGLDI